MLKIILLMLLLAFACAAAMTLIRRLNTIASQMGDLKRDMARNDQELRRRTAAAERERTQNDREN